MGLSTKQFYVKDLVINDEYGTISSTATVQEAAKKMKEIGIPDLVVEDAKTKKVLGVVADFDIVQKVVAEGKDYKTENVTSAMYTIEPVNLNDKVTDAFKRMRDLQVNVIPVVENGKLMGVCTIQDCWSYIPDENIDEIGLIPVQNTKVAEFWFASVASITAFVLGIILPLAGLTGYFITNQENVMALLGLADLRGGNLIFYLFEAHGTDFFVPIISLAERSGGIWITIVVFNVLTLIFGFLSLFSLIYASYADARKIQTGFTIRVILPLLTVVFMAMQWILFAIGFATASLPVAFSIDPIGLTLSITAMVLFIAAVYRDYFFKKKASNMSIPKEVSS